MEGVSGETSSFKNLIPIGDCLMTSTNVQAQIAAFKATYQHLNHWLAEQNGETQITVLKALATSPIMRDSYPVFCRSIDRTTLEEARSDQFPNLFDHIDDSLESVENDLNELFGGQIPEEVQRILASTAVRENGGSLADLARNDEPGSLADLGAETPADAIIIRWIMPAGNNSFEITASSRDEFCDKLVGKIAELKRNGYTDDDLPDSFMYLAETHIRRVAGVIFDENTREAEGVAEVREFVAKKSTGGKN